jgi:hypothetical protein
LPQVDFQSIEWTEDGAPAGQLSVGWQKQVRQGRDFATSVSPNSCDNKSQASQHQAGFTHSSQFGLCNKGNRSETGEAGQNSQEPTEE